jgi:hypothetical protein
MTKSSYFVNRQWSVLTSNFAHNNLLTVDVKKGLGMTSDFLPFWKSSAADFRYNFH